MGWDGMGRDRMGWDWFGPQTSIFNIHTHTHVCLIQDEMCLNYIFFYPATAPTACFDLTGARQPMLDAWTRLNKGRGHVPASSRLLGGHGVGPVWPRGGREWHDRRDARAGAALHEDQRPVSEREDWQQQRRPEEGGGGRVGPGVQGVGGMGEKKGRHERKRYF